METQMVIYEMKMQYLNTCLEQRKSFWSDDTSDYFKKNNFDGV